MIRKDSWTEHEELVLAETVLKHLRTGSTQLKAFEEAGEKLNRSASACSFHWNQEIKKQYIKAVELAKKMRKKLPGNVPSFSTSSLKEEKPVVSVVPNKSSDPLKTVFSSLQEHLKQYEKMKEELKDAKETIATLKAELKDAQSKQVMEEEYQQFIEILNRARHLIS